MTFEEAKIIVGAFSLFTLAVPMIIMGVLMLKLKK